MENIKLVFYLTKFISDFEIKINKKKVIDIEDFNSYLQQFLLSKIQTEMIFP